MRLAKVRLVHGLADDSLAPVDRILAHAALAPNATRSRGDYSIRIATIGLTRPARTAGISMAVKDTSTTPTVTSTTVTESDTPTPNSTLRM